MYDRELVKESLGLIESSLVKVAERTRDITSANDFTGSENGMTLLDSVCMKLQHIGENVKSVDKRTDGELLSKYDEIPWQNIIKLRDKISHHYEEIDAEWIFNIVSNDLEPLLATIRQIIKDF